MWRYRRSRRLVDAATAAGGALTRSWAQRYDAAVRSHTLPPLVEIGRDIAAFLDEGDRWLDRVLAGTGEIGLEVAVPGSPEERERILLDVPWELLRIASATIATGFGDPEQEYFADGTATKNSSP